MSDPKPKPEPDEDLLEFLGGIDEVNDDSQEADFSDFLARTDIDNLAVGGKQPKAPAEGAEK
ncbi:MAG: hypothetical protein ABI821_11760 [Pseudomonadota bacterium]